MTPRIGDKRGGLLRFRKRLSSNGAFGNAGFFAIGAAAVAATVAVVAVWAWRRFGPSTYMRFDTMFGRARVYQVQDGDGRAVRLLEVGGIVQSGTFVDERYTELVFEYLKRYDLMFEAQRPMRRVCVLGCGGYDYPEHLIAHHPGVVVDAVEIDPAITAIARQYFFLDRLIAEYDVEETGRLNLVCSDALEHLLAGVSSDDYSSAFDRPSTEILTTAVSSEDADGLLGFRQGEANVFGAVGDARAAGVCYDAIVNDTFDAGAPPAHLTTAAFAHAVHARLVEGGLYLTNIVSALEGEGSRFLHEQVALLEAEFAHVYVVPCDADSLTEPDNVIVVATDTALPEGLL